MAESGAINDLITGTVVAHDITEPVRFLYDPADPYAVTLDITGHARRATSWDGNPVVWTFARSLLVRGLTGGRAGESDVVIDRNGPWLDIALSSPDGSETLRFPAAAVHRFVVRTEGLVLVGDEARHQADALDDAIAQILGGVR